MSLSPAFLDELRARTSLSGLIGKSVKIQKAGREYKACCPFHHEKTPSFYVNDEKGFYHCFGCQAHGDAIRFLTDAKGLPFMDAVKELADAAGMELPAPDPQARARAERATSLYDAVEAAQRFFEEQLGGLEGGEARAYLAKRGISDETRRRFGFGFAPDARGKLKDALKQFGNEKLIEAGLLVAPDNDREPYDRFRGRLTFPIRDRRGRVIAFSARILGSSEPKYLNSPETPIFDKGRTLFNIDRAAAAARAAGRIIVVEGQMDAIALDQAGISEVVAPLGTAVTETQLEQLWRIEAQPIIFFDGDTAGQRAAVRAAHRALPLLRPGFSLRFAQLPEGQDPDDLIQQGGSAAVLKPLMDAETLVDRIWRAEVESSELATPESRAGLQDRLHQITETIADQTIRRLYWDVLRNRFWDNFGWRKRDVVAVATAQSRSSRSGGDFMHSIFRAILLGLSRFPDVLRDNFEIASKIRLKDPEQRRWLDIISFGVLENPDLDEDLLAQIIADSDVGPMEKRDLTKDLAFSFFRKLEPQRGRTDLRELIGILVAEQEVEEVFARAKLKLEESLEQSDWEDHLRRRQERDNLRERLREMMDEFRGGDEEGLASPSRSA